MGGFTIWIEDVATSRAVADCRRRHSYAETVTRWRGLSYKPSYNAAYCLAVCPAGSDVVAPHEASKGRYRDEVVRSLQGKVEPVYVVANSDAEAYVARRFPHKRARRVRSAARPTTAATFPMGLTLGFRRGKAGDMAATYHFTFTGAEKRLATVAIRDGRLSVGDGHRGTADLAVTADARGWLRFLVGEVSIVRLLLTRAIRLKGPPRLLLALARCFPL